MAHSAPPIPLFLPEKPRPGPQARSLLPRRAMTPLRLAPLGLLSLLALACGASTSGLGPGDGGPAPLDAAAPPSNDGGVTDAGSDTSAEASADAGAVDAELDAPTDAGCGYVVKPCCGGPQLGDAGACTPPPPFCAPLPATCSDGHSCTGICPSGDGLVDGTTKTVQCLCA
jgi:hypothetical protein